MIKMPDDVKHIIISETLERGFKRTRFSHSLTIQSKEFGEVQALYDEIKENIGYQFDDLEKDAALVVSTGVKQRFNVELVTYGIYQNKPVDIIMYGNDFDEFLEFYASDEDGGDVISDDI